MAIYIIISTSTSTTTSPETSTCEVLSDVLPKLRADCWKLTACLYWLNFDLDIGRVKMDRIYMYTSVCRHDTIALGLLKKKKTKKNAYVNCVYYSDVIYSFDWKSAVYRTRRWCLKCVIVCT